MDKGSQVDLFGFVEGYLVGAGVAFLYALLAVAMFWR